MIAPVQQLTPAVGVAARGGVGVGVGFSIGGRVAGNGGDVVCTTVLVGLVAQCVDQPLAYHYHQLAVRYKGLRRLAIQNAAHKLVDGPLQGTKI